MLVQGVPFATLAAATEIASRHRVPTVLLPHYHLEDRYYHWRSYYRAFTQADCVLAAPASSKPLVFDRLGANSTVVPGGGIDLGEYDDARLASGERKFRALHAYGKPFVLVLGRKAAAKNYQQAIDAVQLLNQRDHRVDLVMIGPDDDGVPVSAPNTYYYGAQPRDVVLGALRLAFCLVNMSDSESFGIVVLEAWSAGTPVIVQRRCAAFVELVKNGKNGMLVESVTDIAAAMESYLTDPELGRQHALNGSAIAARHSWPHVAKMIEQVLLKTAAKTQQMDMSGSEPAWNAPAWRCGAMYDEAADFAEHVTQIQRMDEALYEAG